MNEIGMSDFSQTMSQVGVISLKCYF